MSYVLLVFALFPDPMVASRSEPVIAWSKLNTLEECEAKAIQTTRARHFLVLYTACSVHPKRTEP